MDSVMIALIPVIVACVAIQQLLEVADPVISRIVGEKDKKLALGLLSMLAGLVLAFVGGLRILRPIWSANGLDIPMGAADSGDALVTALIVSAGTEGFNSVLKFLGYAKESKKSDAAALSAWVSRDPEAKDVLSRMDRRKSS
ncbi:MAG: hypothetical protein A4E45_00651 [Methanosaeta sp. PtaB.Bin039]|nr:MAG: hypothetical protein A4E45_00651 [Methanosaeta sp. PtaB.Bin039]OPY45710.1 MAG: hypothetical protein A4E47_00866 [Methanosaeta sp. PtaU1.Bin028]HOT07739.1 hypothetical protein [Methanotrichaceae archaeon]HQF16960.1 hypothetical protein [Methanotrichaceae archaeon]HQI91580.1 hypothetical protein [Methanotrichaceae archaeon]